MGVRSITSTRIRFGRIRCTLADRSGNLLDLAAASVQGHAKDAAVVVVNKLLQHGLAAYDVIAAQFNLVRLEQEHRGRIQQKIHP